MKLHYSKTKNFIVYRYLLKYKTKKEALKNKDVLAHGLKRHRNAIISCIAQTQKNPLIYKELKAFGYTESQIPSWFIRPPVEKTQSPPSDENTTTQNQIEQTLQTDTQTTQTPQTQHLTNTRIPDRTNTGPNIQYHPKSLAEQMLDNKVREIQIMHWQNNQDREEEKREDKQERQTMKMIRELNNACDPFTVINIYKKNPRWRAWYNSQTSMERNKTIDSINRLLAARAQTENMRQWNEFFNTWWWGRSMGQW